VKALDFYNNYFGIPYPLPKMDLLAIPDFAAGAMENCLSNMPHARTSALGFPSLSALISVLFLFPHLQGAVSPTARLLS
jgi:hypothetical protein